MFYQSNRTQDQTICFYWQPWIFTVVLRREREGGVVEGATQLGIIIQTTSYYINSTGSMLTADDASYVTRTQTDRPAHSVQSGPGIKIREPLQSCDERLLPMGNNDRKLIKKIKNQSGHTSRQELCSDQKCTELSSMSLRTSWFYACGLRCEEL